MLDENKLELLLLRSRFLKQKEYWNRQLSGEIHLTTLLKEYDNKSPFPEPKKISIAIPPGLSSRVIKLSKESDLSIYIFLLAILEILIARYMSNEDPIVISPINQQKATGETLNEFLFIRTQVNETMTFKDLVLAVRQSVLEAYENQDYPYHKILESLYPAAPGSAAPGQELSRVLCSLRELHGDDYSQSKNIKTALSFCFFKHEGNLAGDILYDANTFKETETRQFSRHFTSIMAAVTTDVNIKISNLGFLTEEEKKQLLVDFNNNSGDFSRQRTIHHFIEDIAGKTPDLVALVCNDEKITYRQLNSDANNLARQLRDHGIGEDIPAAILLNRSPQMVECILAVWKAGGAYIPLSTEYPSHRILEILNDSQAGVLLTESAYISPLNSEKPVNTTIIEVKEPVKSPIDQGGNLDLKINMGILSYIIYTSGTTGKSKGVMIEHRGMMNHLQIKIDDLQLEHNSIVVQNAPSTFDISVWQFFAAMIRGGQITIYPDELIMEPERFLLQLVKDRATILEVVPSYLSVLLEFVKKNQPAPLTLKNLLVTGEEIRPGLVKKWFEYYPYVKMVNAYGPTEASDDITHFIMDKPLEREQVPIGAPLQNFNIYIVDKYMNLCPVGVKGELCVAGVGVGRGYLNRPELTAEKFVINRLALGNGLSPLPPLPILYKTGDLVRWLPDGNIEFFGRIDQQVKIRGYRIELGEIESQLLKHENIKEVVVIAKEMGAAAASGGESDKHLCAYIVANYQLSIPALREYLSGKLPDYMTPTHFFTLDRIPLTPNGKIDRKALPEPGTGIAGEYVAPQDDLDKKLIRIWAELLHLEEEKISIEHDFFQLGGHSLSLIQLISRIYREFKVEISITQIFNNPIIKNISEIIKNNMLDVESPVVFLNPPTSLETREPRKKIFCFPPQVGFGIAYLSLASVIPDYSWYSFNFIEDIEQEERIKIYADCITKLQPAGPYIFFGFSAAGILAFQVAKALENQGHQVSDIIFCDCSFRKSRLPELTEEDKILIYQEIDGLLEGLGATFLREKVIQKTLKYTDFYLNTRNLEKINANVHLIISEEVQNNIKNNIGMSPKCWDEFTSKTSSLYHGTGMHRKMFSPGGPLKNNSQLVRKILANIEQARCS